MVNFMPVPYLKEPDWDVSLVIRNGNIFGAKNDDNKTKRKKEG